MKVVQVVAGVDEKSSGPSYSIPGLCGALASQGVNVKLMVPGNVPSRQYDYEVKSYPRNDYPLITIGRSTELLKALKSELCNADIVHNNGQWLMSNVYPYWAAKGTRCKIVTAPRGTLAPWCKGHHALRKKIFWTLLQREAYLHTDMWHATCEKEYREIRECGYREPVAIVPIGIDIPKVNECSKWSDGIRRITFLGRIHVVKGCDKLVQAWSEIASKLPEWELVIAGPDCGGMSLVEKIINAYHVPRVRIVGEVRGDEKYALLSSSDIYVLPTETENFGITVAEALAAGTPVITTTGTLWSGLNGVSGIGRSGWWIKNDIATLTNVLVEATKMPQEDLLALGQNGKRWMRRDFCWQSVGVAMKSTYEWLLGRREKPDCVRCD